MLILYYSPGACSLASHIALYEAGEKFDLAKVDLKTHTLEDGRSFKDINPKGYVPALQFDNGDVLTENVAILTKIADRHSTLAAPGEYGRYRLLEMLAFISSEIHKFFKPLFSTSSTAEEKQAAKDAIAKRLEFLAKHKQTSGTYLFGDNMTVADAYLFVMLLWAEKIGVKVPDTLKNLAEAMKARPTVHLALKHEGLAA
jgi:glutathione S-transferase